MSAPISKVHKFVVVLDLLQLRDYISSVINTGLEVICGSSVFQDVCPHMQNACTIYTTSPPSSHHALFKMVAPTGEKYTESDDIIQKDRNGFLTNLRDQFLIYGE